eukprot:scaffold43661_cov139-Skeletonema_marinoi.AAC.1
MRIKQKDDKALGLFRNTIRLNLVCLFIGNKRLALSLVLRTRQQNWISSASKHVYKQVRFVGVSIWVVAICHFIFHQFPWEGWQTGRWQTDCIIDETKEWAQSSA